MKSGPTWGFFFSVPGPIKVCFETYFMLVLLMSPFSFPGLSTSWSFFFQAQVRRYSWNPLTLLCSTPSLFRVSPRIPVTWAQKVVIEVTQTHLRITSTRQSILGTAETQPSVKPQIRRLMMA